MNKQEKLVENTIRALTGKLVESKVDIDSIVNDIHDYYKDEQDSNIKTRVNYNEGTVKKSINDYDENVVKEVQNVINDVKSVLSKYAQDIEERDAKVNHIIHCNFKTVEIPNKNGEYTGDYFEIPEDTFEQFIAELKSKGFRQYGQLVWNNFLVVFNNASLTGYVTLGKVFTGFRVMVQIRVDNISTGDTTIKVSVK